MVASSRFFVYYNRQLASKLDICYTPPRSCRRVRGRREMQPGSGTWWPTATPWSRGAPASSFPGSTWSRTWPSCSGAAASSSTGTCWSAPWQPPPWQVRFSAPCFVVFFPGVVFLVGAGFFRVFDFKICQQVPASVAESGMHGSMEQHRDMLERPLAVSALAKKFVFCSLWSFGPLSYLPPLSALTLGGFRLSEGLGLLWHAPALGSGSTGAEAPSGRLRPCSLDTRVPLCGLRIS